MAGHFTKPKALSSVFKIYDFASGVNFLVDTGSQISIPPASKWDRENRSESSSLATANGTSITLFGNHLMTLRFGVKSFRWNFVVTDVSQPILGADFLSAHSLMVDVKGRRLFNMEDFASFRVMPDNSLAPGVYIVTDASGRFENVLTSRPKLIMPTFTNPMPAHGVQHFVKMTGVPVHAQARHLSPEKLGVAKHEFADLKALGIIRRSNSPRASLLHVSRKADGGWLPYGDYRYLNNITVPDRYPIPNIRDFSSRLARKTVFSKVDLVKGYHQVPIHPDDIPKMAIIMPFGLWEFLRMPFGLSSAAQTFQRMMDWVVQDLDFVFCHMDVILIASESDEQHKEHLRILFDRLELHGLIVKPVKCVFGVSSIVFLGHKVDDHGVTPLPARVEAISAFPRPSTVKGLQEFVGMVNFYHRFIPAASGIMQPLFAHSKGKAMDKLQWGEEMTKVFEKVKEALAKATLLHHTVESAETTCDRYFIYSYRRSFATMHLGCLVPVGVLQLNSSTS